MRTDDLLTCRVSASERQLWETASIDRGEKFILTEQLQVLGHPIRNQSSFSIAPFYKAVLSFSALILLESQTIAVARSSLTSEPLSLSRRSVQQKAEVLKQT